VDSAAKTIFTTRPVGDVVVLGIEGEFSVTTSPVPTLHEHVKTHLFHITGLIKVFDVYSTEEAAMESFAKPPSSP